MVEDELLFTLHVLFTVFPLAFLLFVTCWSLIVHGLFSRRPLVAHFLPNMCSLCIHFVFASCSLILKFGSCMSVMCSLFARSSFVCCSLFVYCAFIVCVCVFTCRLRFAQSLFTRVRRPLHLHVFFKGVRWATGEVNLQLMIWVEEMRALSGASRGHAPVFFMSLADCLAALQSAAPPRYED